MKRLSFGILFCALLAFAQQETGSITGQVLDPAGGAVPGAQVTIRNESTSASFKALSDDTGFYRAPQLSPGTYTITATASGFSTLVRGGIVVRVNDRLRVDLPLQVGAVSEQVTVEAAAPLLQAEDATAGQVIDNRRIVEMPLNGRNWLQLATLAPASVTYPGGASVAGNFGGTRSNQTNFLLDGVDHTHFIGKDGNIVNPPIDSVQEFKVQTNNYTADTGRLGGAVVNATIRSGSNRFHGTAYEFIRNRELNARNFFASATTHKPQFTRNQFGASMGGPFVRDKLFFFLNYEGNRQRQDQILTRQVFTDAQKAGDFSSQLGSQIGTDAIGRPVLRGQIFDPFSVRRLASGTPIRDPFLNNIIPASKINPVSKRLIDLVPPPNAAGSPNFIRNLGTSRNNNIFVGRIDWVRSENNTLFATFILADQDQFTAPILGEPLNGGNVSQNFDTNNQRQFTLGWGHVFNPNNLNEFRIGYVRNAGPNRPVGVDQDLNARFGIPFPSPLPKAGGMAGLMISGFTQIGSPTFGTSQFVNKYEISDSYTVIRGAHTFKFGFRGGLKTMYNQTNRALARGQLNFDGVFTNQPGFGGTGSSVADFLTGVANFARLATPVNEKDVGQDIEWFAQDRWRVSSRLTLTLGMRHQFNPPSWEARHKISNVVFDRGFTNAQVVVPKGQSEEIFRSMKDVWFPFITVRRTTELSRGLVRNTYANFAPRLGIAYQMRPRTVVRSGYGVFYGFPDVTSGAVLTVNPPNRVLVSASSNTIDPTMFIDKSVFGPTPFSQALVNPGFNNIRDPHMPPDLTQMYNLSVQHELAADWLLEIGFLGNRSSRVAVVTQLNDASPALPADTSTPQSRRRVSKVLGALPYLAPQGFSNYHALILNLEKRFSRGLTLLGNYTWSRALGVAPAVTAGINGTPIQDPFNLKREYGPLEFDVINHASISYVYELPFGRGKRYLGGISRAVNQLVGGWEVAGITTFQGGFPITPVLSNSLGKTDTPSRPNAIGDPTNTSRQPHDWINRAAFAVPSSAEVAAGNFYGNAGYNSIRAPGLVNFDFSVLKSFPLQETLRMQFRAEFFNTTNTPFFGLPGSVGTNFNAPTFGRVTLAGDPRVVQFGLKLMF